MKKNLVNLLFLSISLILAINPAHADDKDLIGLWKGEGISLQLKANHQYRYKMKLLNITGKWSTNKTAITLNYSILGIKNKKESQFVRTGNQLVLTRKGKKAIHLIKQ